MGAETTAMIYLAFDPGDKWCGVAALAANADEEIVCAESRVLCASDRSFSSLINDMAWCSRRGCKPAVKNITGIGEDFRVRPVGHQRFTAAHPVKILGALQYRFESDGSPWHLVSPGNAEREVPLLVNGLLTDWRLNWRNGNDPNWRHAWSAWRVLLRHLMTADVALLRALRFDSVSVSRTETSQWLPIQRVRTHDLTTPAVRWTVPNASARLASSKKSTRR
jgi:hypothetical protein